MSILSYFIWSPDPEIFRIPVIDHPIVWYGLLFALGFLVAQQVTYWVFKVEGKSAKDVDQITMYSVVAVVLGARLGHCLFYNPGFYLSNPIEIIKVWEGGLASHGAGIGMFIALYLYSKKHEDQSYRWVLDRIAIVTVLIGAFIRFGNYMNSEIIGIPTGSDQGVVFARNAEELFMQYDDRIEGITFQKDHETQSPEAGKVPITVVLKYQEGVEIDDSQAALMFNNRIPSAINRYQHLKDHVAVPEGTDNFNIYKSEGRQYAEVSLLGIPRHPAQLYESLACIVMFLILAHVWYHHRQNLKEGFLFGFFMAMLWAERFVDEFFKENQEAWEADIPLNMGQWLSIPMFIAGVTIMIIYWGKPKEK